MALPDSFGDRYHGSRPSFTVLASGNRRHNERERWVTNAIRHESVQLCRRLRILGLQQQRELARVRCAQLELTRSLDRLRGHRPSVQHVVTQPDTSSVRLRPLRLREHLPAQSCCPNHIVCSSCNLRLRLADVLLHRFTPALWTMYCHPLPKACPGDSVYSMPSFMERRNLATSIFHDSFTHVQSGWQKDTVYEGCQYKRMTNAVQRKQKHSNNSKKPC